MASRSNVKDKSKQPNKAKLLAKKKPPTKNTPDSDDSDEFSRNRYTPEDLVDIARKRADTAEALANLERQIYAFEGSYLEETCLRGSLLTGWATGTSGTGPSTSRLGTNIASTGAVGTEKKARKFDESERLFSRSSISYKPAVTGILDVDKTKSSDSSSSSEDERRKTRKFKSFMDLGMDEFRKKMGVGNFKSVASTSKKIEDEFDRLRDAPPLMDMHQFKFDSKPSTSSKFEPKLSTSSKFEPRPSTSSKFELKPSVLSKFEPTPFTLSQFESTPSTSSIFKSKTFASSKYEEDAKKMRTNFNASNFGSSSSKIPGTVHTKILGGFVVPVSSDSMGNISSVSRDGNKGKGKPRTKKAPLSVEAKLTKKMNKLKRPT